MNYTVFYSWQSDLDNKFNRSFIEDALEKASRSISNSDEFALQAVVDRDTYGIPGSPSIVESITGKIANSDVFVCDISIINSSSDGRKTPNPNVLYELGFASAILGWDRIIMVQNGAYGGPDMLPFDLRGRRILQYFIDETIENRSNEKQRLKQKLIETFSDALKYYSNNVLNTKEKVIWWGSWNMESKIKFHGGQLQISRVSSDAFFYDLKIFDGARTGEVHGRAQILTPHSAYSKILTIDNSKCEIIFRRKLNGDNWFIDVEEGPNCSTFHGMGTSFAGTYKHEAEQIVNREFLDEIDLNEIARLTGRYLSTFLTNLQQIQLVEDNWGTELTIIKGGVKGLYTIMESIIILDQSGGLWCACLDPEVEAVRYFTNIINDLEQKPDAMVEWLDRFVDRQLIINHSG